MAAADEPLEIRPARPAELGAIERLVREARLPTDGLEDVWRTWVAVEHGRVVGTVSLERYENALLLRSMAVESSHRGSGVGGALIGVLLETADEIGPVALLTEGAASWFERFGFETVDRSKLDARLQASVELRYACPATATALVRHDPDDRSQKLQPGALR